MTAQQHRDRWSYVILAEELRRISANPKQDAAELFRRMVFNALISNTDDHPRNHAAIAKGKGLAPVAGLRPDAVDADQPGAARSCHGLRGLGPIRPRGKPAFAKARASTSNAIRRNRSSPPWRSRLQKPGTKPRVVPACRKRIARRSGRRSPIRDSDWLLAGSLRIDFAMRSEEKKGGSERRR